MSITRLLQLFVMRETAVRENCTRRVLESEELIADAAHTAREHILHYAVQGLRD